MGDKSCHYSPNAVRDNTERTSWKLSLSMLKDGGTIFASPVINRGSQPSHALAAGSTDSSVVVRNHGHAVICEPTRERFVEELRNTRARIYDGDRFRVRSIIRAVKSNLKRIPVLLGANR